MRLRQFLLVSMLVGAPGVALAQQPQAQAQPSSCEVVRSNFASQIGVQATEIMDLQKLVFQCRQELATEKAKEEKKDAPKPATPSK